MMRNPTADGRPRISPLRDESRQSRGGHAPADSRPGRRFFYRLILAAALLLVPTPAAAEFAQLYDGAAIWCDGELRGVGYGWGGEPLPTGTTVLATRLIAAVPPHHTINAWVQRSTADYDVYVGLWDANASDGWRWFNVVGPDGGGTMTWVQPSHLYVACAPEYGYPPSVVGVSVYVRFTR